MATLSRSIRRGLPRVEGGEPWPPAGQAPARIVTAEAATRQKRPICRRTGFRGGIGRGRRALPPPAAVQETAPGAALSAPVPARELRRRGGAAASPRPAARAGRRTLAAGGRRLRYRWRLCPGLPPPAPRRHLPQMQPQMLPRLVLPRKQRCRQRRRLQLLRPAAPATPTTGTTSLRRGLPRVPGGEPWPPAGLAPAAAAAPAVQAGPQHIADAELEPSASSAPAATTAPAPEAQPAAAAPAPQCTRGAARRPGARSAARRHRRGTRRQHPRHGPPPSKSP